MTAPDPFAAFMALAFPWLPPHSADYRNMRAAWDAGFEAGSEAGLEAQLKDAEMEEAQIWLSDDGKDLVAVNFIGFPDPLLMPFFVPAPDLPIFASCGGQVDAAQSQIDTLRRFSSGLISMADDAQSALDDIMEGR